MQTVLQKKISIFKVPVEYDNECTECEIYVDDNDNVIKIEGYPQTFMGQISVDDYEDFTYWFNNDATRISLIKGQYEIIILDMDNVDGIENRMMILEQLLKLSNAQMIGRIQWLNRDEGYDNNYLALHVSESGMLRGK